MVVSLLMNISSQVNVFLRGGDSEGWGGGLVGLDEGGMYWPKVFARVGALSYDEFCFFAVTSVTADGVENTSSSQKRRVVLIKTSYRFAENNVSFC